MYFEGNQEGEELPIQKINQNVQENKENKIKYKDIINVFQLKCYFNWSLTSKLRSYEKIMGFKSLFDALWFKVNSIYLTHPSRLHSRQTVFFILSIQ